MKQFDPNSLGGKTVRNQNWWRGTMQWVGYVVLYLTIGIAGLAMLEMRWEDIHEKQWRTMVKQVDPYYWWKTYTSNGTPVGERRGPLKLMLRPDIVYGNFPAVDHPNFTVSSRGFRGDRLHAGRASRKRVVFVGGSTAFGTGLRSDQETYARQLEEIDPELEVINAGVIGHQSGNELSYLVSELIDLQPDLVVALDGWNDYAQVGRFKTVANLGFGGFEQIERGLESYSRLVGGTFAQRAANITGLMFPRTQAWLGERQQGKGARVSSVSSVHERETTRKMAVERYVKNLARMNRIARAYGIGFLSVLQPQRNEVPPDTGAGVPYKEFRKLAKRGLTDAGVAVLDIGDYIAHFERKMFLDRMHLDAAGNKILGQLMLPEIRRVLGRSEAR